MSALMEPITGTMLLQSRGETASKPGNPTLPNLADGLVDATGQVVNCESIDSLWEAIDRMKELAAASRAVEWRCREILSAKLDKNGKKTQRLRGSRYLLKAELPDDKWDQSKLKEAWNSYPQFRSLGEKPLLKIGEISVSIVEFKKLLDTKSDDLAFGVFKGMVTSANKGHGDSLPTITVEGEIEPCPKEIAAAIEAEEELEEEEERSQLDEFANL